MQIASSVIRTFVSANIPRTYRLRLRQIQVAGAEPFEQQQYGTAGVEGVNATKHV